MLRYQRAERLHLALIHHGLVRMVAVKPTVSRVFLHRPLGVLAVVVLRLAEIVHMHVRVVDLKTRRAVGSVNHFHVGVGWRRIRR